MPVKSAFNSSSKTIVKKRNYQSLITLVWANITDTSWVVHKSKMLQAVRISCPRKFIINNHIFSSYRSLYKAPFIFLSSFRFCVYGSHILFIKSLRFFDSTLSIFLSLTFASQKNNSASTPSSQSHKRIPKTCCNTLYFRLCFLFVKKKIQKSTKINKRQQKCVHTFNFCISFYSKQSRLRFVHMHSSFSFLGCTLRVLICTSFFLLVFLSSWRVYRMVCTVPKPSPGIQ